MVISTTAAGAMRRRGPGDERWAARERRLRAQVGVLVVGDTDFRAAVAANAPRARRRVVGHVILPSQEAPGTPIAGSTPFLFGPRRGSWHELIVEDRLLAETRRHCPDLLARASRTWLVPSGEGVDGRSIFVGLPPAGRAVKRSLDVLLSIVALVLSLPLLLVALVAVKLDSPGPALFTQVRVGANGRRFRLYKIRTMTTDNDDSEHRAYYAALVRGEAHPEGDLFKLRHDHRLTRVGALLRRLSIDELPQLWNVLRGEMSLVGPRPIQPHELELCPEVAWQRLRVKPGITGAWQVSGRSRLTFDQMVALDIEYWRTWSLRSDLKILLRTPKAVLADRGTA